MALRGEDVSIREHERREEEDRFKNKIVYINVCVCVKRTVCLFHQSGQRVNEELRGVFFQLFPLKALKANQPVFRSNRKECFCSATDWNWIKRKPRLHNLDHHLVPAVLWL